MLSPNILLLVCLGYVAFLFAVAFIVDRRTRRGRMNWLHSPVIYTLSISVYCTSWTFYGAVGSAARNGLEFITIYLGPSLVFIGWWWLLRKLVRIGRAHRITSIADLISSRYGKSPSIAVIVTLIALIATTPYIALQLQSVTLSYEVFVGSIDHNLTAFWIAAGMALFTILFGTRNLDANERHHGVVAAIAVEAVVKFVALFAIGLYVTYGISDGFGDIFSNVPESTIRGANDIFGVKWVILTFLSATAIICLPRQFQVTVVENIEERHLATASWLFPLYLLGMTIFILPIALAGQNILPAGSNPDLYVLTLPLAGEDQELALLAFLGGFSSATSMVIVAAIAVSTMVSNHIIMPLVLRFLAAREAVSGDFRSLLLTSRRISIAFILGLGFLYFWLSGGSDALAAIGLIAFAGVAQFLPSLLGGIFWRGATRTGALAGLIFGFSIWAYTLFLPSFGGDFILTKSILEEGPWGIALLRPQALFGLEGLDPLVHAVIWSMSANILAFFCVSSFSTSSELERLQATLFVDVFRSAGGAPLRRVGAEPEDLFVLAQRILGAEPARRLFDEMAREQGTSGGLPHPTDAVISRLERELAGSIGAASAHALVSRIAGRETVGMNELIDIADETQKFIETSRQLSEKSAELEQAAEQLRSANQLLRDLDTQKDEFLSQVSHELRTPMTSIRSFAEILLSQKNVSDRDRQKFVSIILEESQRLTRLLDEILDISRLEAGTMHIQISTLDPNRAIEKSVETLFGIARDDGVSLETTLDPAVDQVAANDDRLHQVLINILSNAIKYNRAENPSVHVGISQAENHVFIDIRDNGGGVGREDAGLVFEKFSRGSASSHTSGAGLGLPISRAIMRAMNGDLDLKFRGDGTSYFRLTLSAPN